MSTEKNGRSSRRRFLKQSVLASSAIASSVAFVRPVHAAGDDTLRIGLIGCGGRGSGAALDAVRADKAAKLVAMGDTFADRIAGSLANLKKEAPDKVDVPRERQFVGFDAYKHVINSGIDVVILASPPHFRPVHLKAAVDAGKHCFVEKPIAVDAPGVRGVLATCEDARKKGLSIVSGLCWRYDLPKQETMKRIHDGAIGNIVTLEANYLTCRLKYFNREPTWSEMEWQIRNWQYVNWVSGDHIVEQHVHSLDKAAWAMHEEPPVRCIGLGGRQVLPCPEYGNNFDHFSVVYEYSGGQKLFSRCRQIDGCTDDVTDYLFGTKGVCALMNNSIDGETKWRYRGKSPSMYQDEHNALFASIRSGQPIDNGLYMSRSTMMAIMGRMSAYSGKEITWDQAMNSQETLTLEKYDWQSAPQLNLAMPGISRFV
jgi:predicted dehydrogenase